MIHTARTLLTIPVPQTSNSSGEILWFLLLRTYTLSHATNPTIAVILLSSVPLTGDTSAFLCLSSRRPLLYLSIQCLTRSSPSHATSCIYCYDDQTGPLSDTPASTINRPTLLSHEFLKDKGFVSALFYHHCSIASWTATAEHRADESNVIRGAGIQAGNSAKWLNFVSVFLSSSKAEFLEHFNSQV